MKKIHNFDTVFDSQELFRLLLKAVSNPLNIVNIKPYADKLFGTEKEFLAIAMAVLDNEVSFNTCENRELSDEIISLTLSQRAEISDADFIFINDAGQLRKVVEHAKCGTLADPHKSATIIVKITDQTDVTIKLRGAGIDGTAEIETDSIVYQALKLRDHMFFEYPQGLDFIFICGNGDLFAVPRLTKQEVF